jgi:hypothetical protein
VVVKPICSAVDYCFVLSFLQLYFAVVNNDSLLSRRWGEGGGGGDGEAG